MVINNISIKDTYIKLSPIEHILKKPSMYIGDVDLRYEKQLIYSNTIIEEYINWSPGLYKIIDELIVNVYDQTLRDTTLKNISTEIYSSHFIILNDGIGIDIVIHPTYNIYIPELIFANLLTSTNYNDDQERITGGTHGLGAKLSVIFSTKFILEVWDKKRKLYYQQIFENNLSTIHKPIIKKTFNNEGGVKITIYPDFSKFKVNEFDDNMIKLIKRRIIDLTALCRNDIIINLNNKKLNSGFEEYLKLYESEYKWIIGKCLKNKHWKLAIRYNDNLLDTHISFVNGIFTNKGGKHIDYILDLLLNKFQKIINPDITKKIINENITICLISSIINPTFNSQTKEELNTPINKFGFECKIDNIFWDTIINSSIYNLLNEIVSLQHKKILSKLDGTKKQKIKYISKLEDANYAGTKKSINTTLILTEGDSAKATAISGISVIPNGRNYFGVYPLRGKLLNVRDASTQQINNNQEINDIKKILGLKIGTIYDENNINELRYGSVMIMTDADEDGTHIKGLIINFFDYFYPSLLKIEGFIKILVTPLVKATKNNEILHFFNMRSYKTWKEQTDTIWKIKYYKGLGTSTRYEAEQYFKNIDNNIINILNKDTNKDILLAFSKDKITERKSWLLNYEPEKILELNPPTTITIKDFVHRELIHFSNYDNIRSIPSLSDGFKPSQRKVLYACLKRNLINELKVAQLASNVAETSAYHHGETSLILTIINMAQNYVGSNNLNLLKPQGQFGTRLMGGKDHSSARYIYTLLENYVFKIFKKIDNELLEYLEDDGIKIEPKFYLPIIPTILINGTEGIGTGFSTFIPNYNIKDIILWIKNKLSNKINNNELIPYYKYFKGNIIKYDDTTWLSQGILNIDEKNNQIIITELPIKYWTNDYKDFLEELISQNKIFKSYTNMSSDIDINFIIKFNSEHFNDINNMYNTFDDKNLNLLYKYLKLYKTIKISNMTLYDVNHKIKLYNSPYQILEEFYNWRIEFYNKRKILIINKLNQEINYINNQIKFINLVNKNNLFIKDDIYINNFLEKNKIDKYNNSYDYLTTMTFKSFNKNNIDKLNNNLNNLTNELKQIKDKNYKNIWLDDLIELENIL